MPWRNSLTIDEAIVSLNDMLKADARAMTALVEQRVACNEAMANHPSVQVTKRGNAHAMGLLGVLNGIFGADKTGWGPISAVFEDDDLNTVVGFKRTDAPEVRRG